MIVYNVIQAEKKETNLIGSYAGLFGLNPVPDKGQTLYWTGHQYTGARMKLDVPLIRTEKEESLVDFDGSGIVVRALAERTADYFEQEISRQERGSWVAAPGTAEAQIQDYGRSRSSQGCVLLSARSSRFSAPSPSRS